MRINILKHNCGDFNMFQAFITKDFNRLKDNCPFYWKMPGGGKTYTGNIHFFTFLGIRLTISTIKKKNLWTT